MTSNLAAASNIANLKTRRERRYKGMESLNFNKLINQFLGWRITFILHCGNDLLTDFYKNFLKFKENFPKNGKAINNSHLGTTGTICLVTYNLSRNFWYFKEGNFFVDLFSWVTLLIFPVDLISRIAYRWIFREDLFSRILVLSMFYIFWFFRGLFFS